MYSIEFSSDLVQIQVRETVSGVFLLQMGIPIQVWHMVEVTQRDFNEHHMMQVPMTENQLGEMQLTEEVAEHVGMNYPEPPDSRYVAQPVDDFLFPCEEAGSAENTITIDADEGFSVTMTPPALQQPIQARPALRSIENLENSRQLFF